MLKVGRPCARRASDKSALLFFVNFYVKAGARVGRWCIKIIFNKKIKDLTMCRKLANGGLAEHLIKSLYYFL